ncbi:hypothetical protein [Paraburkholderia tropica]|uniref:hypothetical protein n=1 Tax=Paraburkholderia tropica TaxID=92647 RepID=UPI001F2A8835|nr:hypothetical protein [Paraburkholderia tropica]
METTVKFKQVCQVTTQLDGSVAITFRQRRINWAKADMLIALPGFALAIVGLLASAVVGVSHGIILGLLTLFVVFFLPIIVFYRLNWATATATVSVERDGIRWGRHAMSYDDIESFGWKFVTRTGQRKANDSYVYITAKGREIVVTKEINGEGARDIAEALDKAAAHQVNQLSPIAG